MASLLSARFFAEEADPIPLQFHDDPAPRPARAFAPFDEEEVGVLLRLTANKSVPGTSGIGWSLLKKGWDAVKDHLLTIYNACFYLGHHVTDLQGPPSERMQMEKIRDLKSLARQYARDQGSCDDTRISYLEYVESEAEADWTLARMIAG
jgi:hypothetical protein